MKKLFILFFISAMPMDAQEVNEKLIHGKIVVNSTSLTGIDVVNLANEKATVTNSNGEFFILAKADDVLVFSASHLEFNRKIIEESDLKSDIVIVNMIVKSIELDEVVVNQHPEINAVSMGILQQEAKHYTPAERKLKTAGDFKPIQLLAILGGSMPLDPIINAINGRTKRLKKQIKIEKKEFLLKKIDETYEEEYFVENLKIPREYIKGFQYYLIENNKFVENLKSNNTAMATFLMGELAVKYNEMIACEQE